MAALRLQTFGELTLRTEDGNVVRFPQKALLLVCFLSLGHRRSIGRDEASTLLWPDAERHARHINLRKMVSRIREVQAAAGHAILLIDDLSVALSGNGRLLRVDALRLRCADTPLDAMLDLVRERFLGGIALGPGPLSRWAAGESDRHHRLVRDRLLAPAAGGPSGRDAASIRDAAFLLLERNVHDEAVRRCLDIDGAATGSLRVFAAPETARSADAPGPLALAPLTISAAIPRLALFSPTLRHGVSRTLAGTASALIDDIAISLCTWRNVAIVAPHTAKRIQESDDRVAMLDKHAVSYLVDTTLSPEGLLVQIVFVPLDKILWAERFPLEVPWSSHRKAIAGVIAESVAAQLQRNERPLTEYEHHPDAYHAYLAGLRQTKNLTLPSIRGARRGFRQALQHRRNFVPGHSGLAWTYSLEWVLTASGDRTLLLKAEEHARAAIERDPTGAAGHKELGVAKLYLGHLDDSLEALARAEELSPHYADAVYSYADSLVHASRPAEGLAKIERAISLNPLCPDDYFWSAAGASYFVGQYQRAIDYIDRMAVQSSADRLRAASFAMLGDTRTARRFRRKDREANPHFDLDQWLAVIPIRETWQKDLYREGLSRAGY